MAKAHKPTSQEAFLLKRKLKVDGLSESEWEDFIQELNQHPCIDFAELQWGDQLNVTYDGTHWSTDELLGLVQSHGGKLRDGWWTRRKLAWYRFTDDNVRANASHEPFCCSKIPPMKK
ncbi:hypothetical protein MSNKSG1_15332 [Marinobacter santoriniensis NKSG1]|uniref:Uncharacterized protein n=1 Tax=Marinobacter santoriniensis NKSG1 TaxID=1288826 RepID=M7CNE2_9GAMM|nr:hypothetical protein [Marinobacter santoriniensis]EMP54694.1 hypothetical protein MSNKSG1_15332 [Marinobacter santoriniensis NKSG1]